MRVAKRACHDGKVMSSPLDGLLPWYRSQARDLPWRAPSRTAWQVLVSEFMLQQTPVDRVLPVYRAWVERWPTPAALSEAPVAEAIRAWGRLGYPRRALRLHAAASRCVERHSGEVPENFDDLMALPGVGQYTAAAVASFAFHQRQAVLDTNVRRVHARLLDGRAFESAGAPTLSERARALDLLPKDGDVAAETSVAVMELGALVCTSRTPRCTECPLRATCRWRALGQPEWDGPPRKGQTYEGTDRQCRGRILARLREFPEPQTHNDLAACWPTTVQFERCLTGLIDDGLVASHTASHPRQYVYRLPD